jgi:hypothetical protein
VEISEGLEIPARSARGPYRCRRTRAPSLRIAMESGRGGFRQALQVSSALLLRRRTGLTKLMMKPSRARCSSLRTVTATGRGARRRGRASLPSAEA